MTIAAPFRCANDTPNVDLDLQRGLLLPDRPPGRNLASDQGVRGEPVVFSASMSAYLTDLLGTVPLWEVSTMLRSGKVPDKRLLQKVEQRVSRTGLNSQSKIAVQVRNGDITLSGTLQYETQRRPVLRAARGVEGVRRIVDQMLVKPPRKKWQ